MVIACLICFAGGVAVGALAFYASTLGDNA